MEMAVDEEKKMMRNYGVKKMMIRSDDDGDAGDDGDDLEMMLEMYLIKLFDFNKDNLIRKLIFTYN